MINLDKKQINFLGHRKTFLIVALCLLLVSAIALCTKGLALSTEFVGGSTITYINVPNDADENTVRDALAEAGYAGDAQVQTMSSNGVDGFMARIDSTDPQATEKVAMSAAETLGVEDGDVQVSTIGPNWGASVVQSTAVAFIVAMVLIFCYIWLRFHDWKMGAVALADMLFDGIVTLGIISLVGLFYEVTISPAVVSALLVILAYSTYDVIVSFRSLEDTKDKVHKQGFITVANNAINQVIVRSMNTTITTIVPVVAMLVLGGSTLTDFAIVIVVGLLVGAASTICVAMPLYTIWRSHDLEPAKMNAKYGMAVNTDTAEIMGYEKGPDDIPAYIEARKAAFAAAAE